MESEEERLHLVVGGVPAHNFLGAIYGLGIAIMLSLLIVIYKNVTSEIPVIWSIPNTNHYRHVQQLEKGNFICGVLVVRIGTSSVCTL